MLEGNSEGHFKRGVPRKGELNEESSEASNTEDLEREFVLKIYKQYDMFFSRGTSALILITPIFYCLKITSYLSQSSSRPSLLFILFEFVYTCMVASLFLYGFTKKTSIGPIELNKLMCGCAFCWGSGLPLAFLFCLTEKRTIAHFFIIVFVSSVWWAVWTFFFFQFKKFLKMHEEFVDEKLAISFQ